MRNREQDHGNLGMFARRNGASGRHGDGGSPGRRLGAVAVTTTLMVTVALALALALALGSVMVPVAGASGSVGPVATAGTDPVTNAEAQATQTAQQIALIGQQIDALSQQYDQATVQATQLSEAVSGTQTQIAAIQSEVNVQTDQLRRDAVSSLIDDSSSAEISALFDTQSPGAGPRQEYTHVVTTSVESTIASLHRAEGQLKAKNDVLVGESRKVQAAVAAAATARHQAATQLAQQQTILLSQTATVQGLLSTQALGYAASQQRLALDVLQSPPPNGPAGLDAVYWAETQLGVQYQWGAEEPGVGFDCSGLTAWAWGRAGVPLTHYSGSQFDETSPVPLSDLEPGDLLFYGPSGSEHVAMYIGNGEMIEAPHTGATVWVTAIRTGAGFVGAGRPRSFLGSSQSASG